MKNQYSVILSISSDIGFEIAKSWIGKKKIIGTYLTESKKTQFLKSKGVKLFKVDFRKKQNIDDFCKQISKKELKNIISAVGSQNPIGRFNCLKFDLWTNYIFVNSFNQIRFFLKLKKNKKKTN